MTRRQIAVDVLGLAGVAVTLRGVWLLSPIAVWIIGGIAMVAIAAVLTGRGDP